MVVARDPQFVGQKDETILRNTLEEAQALLDAMTEAQKVPAPANISAVAHFPTPRVADDWICRGRFTPG